jgi:hypothetical protein
MSSQQNSIDEHNIEDYGGEGAQAMMDNADTK